MPGSQYHFTWLLEQDLRPGLNMTIIGDVILPRLMQVWPMSALNYYDESGRWPASEKSRMEVEIRSQWFAGLYLSILITCVEI